MKSIKIFNLLMVTVAMLAVTSCGKEEDEAPEPTYCYECAVTRDVDRNNGYASVATTTTDTRCGLTPSRAKKMEQEGTWRRQEPDEWGIRLIWVDQKTICKRK